MQKTIVVEVSRRVPHPLYKRIISKRKKFYAHDEEGTAKLGDVVRIIECRPLSKLKRWRLGDVMRRARAGGARSRTDLDVKSLGPGKSGARMPVPTTEQIYDWNANNSRGGR